MVLEKRYFQAEVKAFNDAELVIDHFISTEDVDRSQDVMRADGMLLDGTPSVLRDHGLDPTAGMEPHAKCEDIAVAVNDKGKRGIRVKTKYFPDDTGKRLYAKARDGYMPYWSIGFQIIEAVPRAGGGRDVKKWKLYEYSQVGVPDNINAKSFDPRTAKPEDVFTFRVPEYGTVVVKASADAIKKFNLESVSDFKNIPYCGAEITYDPFHKCFYASKSVGDEAINDLGEEEPMNEPNSTPTPDHAVPEPSAPEPPDPAPDTGNPPDDASPPSPPTGDPEPTPEPGQDQPSGVEPTDQKSLTSSVSTSTPARALESTTLQFIDRIYWDVEDEKVLKALIKEHAALIEKYAIDLFNALQAMEAENKSFSTMSREEKKAFINEYLHKSASGDPAPQNPALAGDDSSPVLIVDSAGMPVETKSVIDGIDAEQFKSLVADSVKEEMKDFRRRVFGKVD